MVNKKNGISSLRIRVDKTIKGGKPLKPLKCNLRCIWCHGDYFRHKTGKLAINNKKIVKAVKLLISASFRPRVRIYISGQGEPTLAGVSELCNLISQLRLIPQVSNIKLTTNGILLEGMAEELTTAGLDEVAISINSLNPKIYLRITQRDLLPKALKGVRAAIKAGLKTKINVVYCKLNADEIHDFLRFSGANTGIPIKFFPLLISNSLSQKLYLPLDHLKEQLEPLATSKKHLTKPYKAYQYSFDDLGANVILKTAGETNSCPNVNCKWRKKCLEGCRSAVRISQDGTLHPCGVRIDNAIPLTDDVTVEEIRKALLSGGKN